VKRCERKFSAESDENTQEDLNLLEDDFCVRATRTLILLCCSHEKMIGSSAIMRTYTAILNNVEFLMQKRRRTQGEDNFSKDNNLSFSIF